MAPKHSEPKKRQIRSPRCPSCREVVTLETAKVLENELSVYLRERMYYCPSCGAVLGIACWHQMG